MKDHFDRWLSRHPRTQHRRTGKEVSGIGNTIFKTYWFSWPDSDTFKQRLIELLACYPDGVIANEDEESCETIWEAVTGVIREQKTLSERMIPPSVKTAFDAARQQRMARPGYSESDSWHWGRVDGYACFVNNFAADGVPNSVTEWSRDRLRQGHDYEGHVDSITALRVDVIARIAKELNPALASAIVRLGEEKETNPVLAIGGASTPVAAVPESALSAAWFLRTPRRFQGYALPLYKFLKSSHDADASQVPNAREILESFRANQPDEVAKVLFDGIDYYDARGNTKYANLKAISEAIKRLTTLSNGKLRHDSLDKATTRSTS